MNLMMRVGALFGFASAVGFAESWPAALVDCNCYESMERNVNPFETSGAARDTRRQIKSCSPNVRTKIFAVVLRDGTLLKLDSGGNLKAAELASKGGKKSPFMITVTGEMTKDILKVESIAAK